MLRFVLTHGFKATVTTMEKRKLEESGAHDETVAPFADGNDNQQSMKVKKLTTFKRERPSNIPLIPQTIMCVHMP